jgi:hypothetical protein
MSYIKVGSIAAAGLTALALAGGAYADPGKSPNGAPGPAGNPNQPASAPQSDNGPQGPAGNPNQPTAAPQGGGGSASTHGKSESHRSAGSHGKSTTHPAHSHANPNPGTPRKGGREDRPAGKITICHATKSHTNPYVEITISVNGLHGHGPADDPHHHAGSWKDIIPAPAGGCPTTVQQDSGQQGQQDNEHKGGSNSEEQSSNSASLVAPRPEVSVGAPSGLEVLGEQASGRNGGPSGESKVLGAQAAGGGTAPKAAVAARQASNKHGSLPFTGFGLVIVLLVAAAAIAGGIALRRASVAGRS